MYLQYSNPSPVQYDQVKTHGKTVYNKFLNNITQEILRKFLYESGQEKEARKEVWGWQYSWKQT